MRSTRAIVLAIATALSALAACGCARQGEVRSVSVAAVGPQSLCRDFAERRFDGARIELTRVVAAADGLPAYCRIRGVIEPNIRYEARLPLDEWNGKYYQSGCGGYCGQVLPDKPGFSNSINEALKRGYATITTDSGHESDSLGDASWARGDPEAVEVYAYRGIRLTHAFGTAMTRSYYDAPPRYEYFSGCSNGGRMAAMAAQRYPDLFDGILSGAPVLDLSASGGVYGSWVVQSNTDAAGDRILTAGNFAHKLPALEAAVLAQCDGADGHEDGIIGAPRACRVDLAALPACEDEAGDGTDAVCFTTAEREVLGRWYRGPRDSSGRQLFPGMPPGSERYWRVWFLDAGDRTAPGNALGGGYARNLGFAESVPADWTALDFDFDADPARLEETAALLDALNPDLGEFREAGGKLLMWHGWADPLVLPDQSVDYYRAVAARMDGDDSVRAFFRLFMIPGYGHCWELPAGTPDRFDPIRLLERWVEQGEAPEQITVESDDPAMEPARLTVCAYPGGTTTGAAESPLAACGPEGDGAEVDAISMQ